MGAGNPIIRGLDDRYDPTTYFLDFTDLFEKEKIVKEWCKDNDVKFKKLTEDEIDMHFNKIVEWEVESFQKDYFFNLDKDEMVADWEEPDDRDRYISECSGSFRGSAYVLAMNDDALILSTDEAEVHHYPFGIIPRLNFDDIYDDLWDENSDKRDWYLARGWDFDERVTGLTERKYDKLFDKWVAKYEPFMRKFHEHWGKIMSTRNGPWMSTSIKTIGNEYKFL